jgi:hypothetical protein
MKYFNWFCCYQVYAVDASEIALQVFCGSTAYNWFHLVILITMLIFCVNVVSQDMGNMALVLLLLDIYVLPFLFLLLEERGGGVFSSCCLSFINNLDDWQQCVFIMSFHIFIF